MSTVNVGAAAVGNQLPLVLFAGLNVLESLELALRVADQLADIAASQNLSCVFKGSFDKANRSSVQSLRGPGLEEGLRILEEVKRATELPLMTDIHELKQAAPVAEVVDCLQIPAFLSRQTDLIAAAAATGLPLNIKKAQFLAPLEMGNIVDKCHHFDARGVMLCERGSTFGYNNLIVDMAGFDQLKSFDCPLLFDVSHALQLPGGRGDAASGRRAQAPALMRSAVAQGIAGLFVETHPNPDEAWCDGACALPLAQLPDFVEQALHFDQLAKKLPCLAIE